MTESNDFHSVSFGDTEDYIYMNNLTKCKCGMPQGESKICPYQLEINDNEYHCDCCDDCQQNCSDEI